MQSIADALQDIRRDLFDLNADVDTICSRIADLQEKIDNLIEKAEEEDEATITFEEEESGGYIICTGPHDPFGDDLESAFQIVSEEPAGPKKREHIKRLTDIIKQYKAVLLQEPEPPIKTIFDEPELCQTFNLVPSDLPPKKQYDDVPFNFMNKRTDDQKKDYYAIYRRYRKVLDSLNELMQQKMLPEKMEKLIDIRTRFLQPWESEMKACLILAKLHDELNDMFESGERGYIQLKLRQMIDIFKSLI